MKIFLNGHELARSAEDNVPVDRVLTELREEIQRTGHVVTRVSLDGRPLTNGWQRRQRLTSPASAVERLDLTIEKPDRLRERTLDDAALLADQLANQAKPLGRKFRVGDEVAANNELASFLDGLKLVLMGLDLSTRMSGGNGQAGPARQRVMSTAEQLLPTLDRIYKAQARGDYIAIADEVEYELRDQIHGWKDLVAEVRRSFNPLPPA